MWGQWNKSSSLFTRDSLLQRTKRHETPFCVCEKACVYTQRGMEVEEEDEEGGRQVWSVCLGELLPHLPRHSSYSFSGAANSQNCGHTHSEKFEIQLVLRVQPKVSDLNNTVNWVLQGLLYALFQQNVFFKFSYISQTGPWCRLFILSL